MVSTTAARQSSTASVTASASAGVDLSGTWKLDEADSDDPQRLLQNQIGPGNGKTNSDGSTGGGSPGGSSFRSEHSTTTFGGPVTHTNPINV
jgi:hypothetical protein